MKRGFVAMVALAMLLVPTASALPQNPTDPIFNGEFEHPFVPDAVTSQLEDGPLDRCIGLGHQALYGEESPQGKATGGTYNDPDPDDADPKQAGEDTAEDPDGTAHNQTRCSFSEDNGFDLVWLSPVDTVESPQHWSLDPRSPGVDYGYNFDGNPFDREAMFVPGQGSRHNTWQAYPSPFQAYTANFSHLTLTVEQGTIPDNALIRFSLASTPLDRQHEEFLLWQDCALSFRGVALKAHQDGDVVEMDPLDAGFSDTNDEDCRHLEDEWNDPETTDAERRQILGRLRIVQVSFWAWNTGEAPVVVDSLHAPGGTTVAQEAAGGNVNPDPQPPEDAFDPEPASKDNGVVMMVHGSNDPDQPVGPPVQEAFYASREGDSVILHVIPYSPNATGTWVPNDLSGANPTLRIEAPGHADLVRSPNVAPGDRQRCSDETTIDGHEGPLAACLVFSVPADQFDLRDTVALTLEWDGGVEVYHNLAHVLMHSSFEGGPITVEQADGLTDRPTPFVVEHHLDLPP